MSVYDVFFVNIRANNKDLPAIFAVFSHASVEASVDSNESYRLMLNKSMTNTKTTSPELHYFIIRKDN